MQRATKLLAAAAALAVLAAASTAAGSTRVAAPCATGSLAGRFDVVPGSAGAGNVVYALRLRNRSRAACFVSGQVGLRLLDRRGRALPTHVVPVHRGMGTAVRVELAPGAFASASARFSPDVPGPGEQTSGLCEPRAYRVRVTVPPGNATLVVPVGPPTAVCEHGSLQLSLLVAGRRPPGT